MALPEAVLLTREGCSYDISKLVVAGEVVNEQDLLERFEAVFETNAPRGLALLSGTLYKASMLGDFVPKNSGARMGWIIEQSTNMVMQSV